MTMHRVGCVCAFPLLAPQLPERQNEMRLRMLQARQQQQQDHANRLARDLMRQDLSWRAVLPILTSHMFQHDGRVWHHVDLERGTIAFSRILRDHTFSTGEYRLLEFAASLFNDNHKLNLYRATSGLDSRCSALVIDAIRTFMGVRQ